MYSAAVKLLQGEADRTTRQDLAAASLERASAASLPAWRRAGAELREAMEAAGWQCAACSIDDVSRRVRWAGQETSGVWREERAAGEDAHLQTAPRV